MHRIGTARRDHVEQLVDGEIGVGDPASAQRVRIASGVDVERVAIRVRVDRNARYAHRVEGPGDAYRDLAAVGDENLAEHLSRRWSRR